MSEPEAPANRRATRGSWRTKLSFALAGTALSLGLGECGLRLYERRERAAQGAGDDAWRERIRRMNRTIYRRSLVPGLVYEPNPNTWVPMPYGPAGFNAGAMRDAHEHALEPDPARPRVAMIGDSLVWSEEVGLDDTLPRRVEEQLASRHAEVLNFGVTGYDTEQEALWFEHHARRYRARTVVVVFCMNDVMIMSGPYNRFATPEEAAQKDAQDALLDRLAPVRAETLDDIAGRAVEASPFHLFTRTRWAVRRALYSRSAEYRDEYTTLYAEPAHRARLHDAIAHLGRAIGATGARAHFVISPVLRDFGRYHWRGIHTWVASEARAAGFIVHDPLDEFVAHERPESLRLPGDSLHYDPRGQRVFARFIAHAIAGGVR
jgi:lysophospholipase L1-like esterase